MPTANIINNQPPFPDDVPICHLFKISCRKLRASNNAESDKLFHACKGTGFFLLDLRDIMEGEKLLEDVEDVLMVDREFGALSRPEKAEYASQPPEVTG